jgi:CRP-like cAMP-binding protein
LEALPEHERNRLIEAAELVEIEQGHSFYNAGQVITHAYFPLSGMSSELIRMDDGRAVDTGPVGKEGFVGLPLLFGDRASSHDCVMQLPGKTWRLRADVVRQMQENSGAFRMLMQRYIRARFLQASQAAACNLLHTVEQRLARWLLISQDHAASVRLPLTHDLISEMLGANRSTVSLIARKLDDLELIEYRRGQIQIANRNRLLEVTCECYSVIAGLLRGITEPRPNRHLF